jgi:hypothetical protein
MFARKVIPILGLTLFVLPFVSLANGRPISQDAGSSAAVSDLLLQARNDAMQLQKDAEELRSFNWEKMTWESHAMKLDQIRDEVNSLGLLVTMLNEQRTKASPQDQQVIDRVTPMLKELAAKVQVAIEDLKNNPEHVQTFSYRDDYSAIAEISSKLAVQISDVVQYDQTNAKLEKLARRLEIS